MNHIKVWLLFWAPANRSSHVPIQTCQNAFSTQKQLLRNPEVLVELRYAPSSLKFAASLARAQ